MNSLSITRRTLLATSMLALVAPAFAASPASYKDANAPVVERVADLLARMTLDEKVAQLRSMWGEKKAIYDAKGDFSRTAAKRVMPHGIGQMARPSDYRGLPRWDNDPYRTIGNTVAFVNAVQRYLVEETRLGIPSLFHDELAHGLLAGDATVFPGPLGLASTWDRGLVEQVFTVAAREARSRGATVALTPVIDLLRDPRYGRAEEFFGEDPYLVGQMGVAAVRGLQGRTRPLAKDRVFSTLKHFVHAVPQGGLNIGPADLGERALRNVFLEPFAQVIHNCDPAIVMPSYNSVDGVPSHENAHLLQTIGRQQLGFKGLYMSDYGGIENLAVQHHVAADKDEAAIMALKAGVQADLPEGASFRGLAALVQAGRVPQSQVDDAVSQILALKFEAGLFETPYVDARLAQRSANLPSHVELARKVAETSVILLKNDGLLPLEPKTPMRLAVIGPNAQEPLFGGYSGDNKGAVGILQGLREGAPSGVTIDHAEGVWITAPDANGRHLTYSKSDPVKPEEDAARIAEAVALARKSDVVLLVLGDAPAVTREAVDWTLPGDRSTLGLWGRQDALVDAIAQTGKPIVALLLNGRPLAISSLLEKVQGLFEGWYLGQEGGRAFADILFGRANPSGKLTVSFPRSVGELPVFYDPVPSADVNQYVEGKREPVFPFGFGLSYTQFDISAPRLDRNSIAASESVTVLVDVANVGQRAGTEVVQLYIRDDISSVPRPILELKGFERIHVQPGDRTTVRFVLTPENLAFCDIDMRHVVEPGSFTILAGGSSAALKSTSLTVVGQPFETERYRAAGRP